MQISWIKNNGIYIISSLIFIIILLISTNIIFSKNKKMDTNEKTLQIEAMELSTKNISDMEDYYKNSLNLKEVKPRDADGVYLGDNDVVIIKLHEDKNLKDPVSGEAGLYHTAIVYPTQKSLAKVVSNLLSKYQYRYQGSADHTATQAFYFSDPDGNGVEVYYDKPKSDWQYDENGKPKMGSARLDEEEFLKQHLNESIEDSGFIKDGHFHLKGGNIEDAKKFYVDSLMFDTIKDSSNALFISRDGYHHHIAINTWESAGAGKRSYGTSGMKSFTLRYYDSNLFKQIKKNLVKNNYTTEDISDKEFKVNDPWNNLIYIKLN